LLSRPDNGSTIKIAATGKLFMAWSINKISRMRSSSREELLYPGLRHELIALTPALDDSTLKPVSLQICMIRVERRIFVPLRRTPRIHLGQ